ncbi:unnamed protein product [Adineta steineri]|uniref:Uncharacterized protein n=1 Tax=Adineta steineri TaxID=433720 RepID=A0A819B9I4_9BILA|nr:unnamed protein product [Adineta steineri]CAF3790555.1 unnamed protein product [Adineta steineri]
MLTHLHDPIHRHLIDDTNIDEQPPSRLTTQPRLTFKEHLQLQLKQHKSHLIALCTLVFLALPRLILYHL